MYSKKKEPEGGVIHQILWTLLHLIAAAGVGGGWRAQAEGHLHNTPTTITFIFSGHKQETLA